MGKEGSNPARAAPTRIPSALLQPWPCPPERVPAEGTECPLSTGTPTVRRWRKLHPGPWWGSFYSTPMHSPGEKLSDDFLTINNISRYVKLRSLWSLPNPRSLISRSGPGKPGKFGSLPTGKGAPGSPGTATSGRPVRREQACLQGLYLGAGLSHLLCPGPFGNQSLHG